MKVDPIGQSVGGLKAHILRRMFHLSMAFIPWIFYEYGDEIGVEWSISKERFASLVIMIIIIGELIRLKLGFVVFGQRQYEANQVSALAWGGFSVGLVLLMFEEAKYNNILFSDADFSVSIQEFDKFVENNKLKADLVIGSRKIKNSLNLNSPIRRKITGAVFTFLVRSLFNISVYDTQCGFKALSIDSFGKTRHKEDGFVFDVELILLAKLKKLEILEIPVKYIHQDRSTVNIYKDSIKMIIGIFRIFKNYKLNKNY